ncbi:hypothetical protein [Nocardioides xinjiangensis]|uniref:hypothetical protein n=1 Tax=Nocardioides xinjiangensis TaxID=2817376 RepID=UPI001B3164DA|nr:hypothetical protein [Nocardioides sp. SYSU D00514]
MPDSVHEGAQDLIRSLAAVAGDETAIYALLTAKIRGTDHESALGGLAAALVVMFTECITTPTSPGEFTEVDLPDGDASDLDDEFDEEFDEEFGDE